MSTETPDTETPNVDTDADTDAEPLWWDPQTLRELYLDERLTRQEVADRLGCARSTVDDWLAQHDIRCGDRADTSGERRRVALDVGQPQALQTHPTAAAKLLRVDDPFYQRECDLSHQAFSRFRIVDIIHHAGPQETYRTNGGDLTALPVGGPRRHPVVGQAAYRPPRGVSRRWLFRDRGAEPSGRAVHLPQRGLRRRVWSCDSAGGARPVSDGVGQFDDDADQTIPVNGELEEAVSWVKLELREARRALWDGKSGKAFASIEAAQNEFETVKEAILDD
jgi:transcriptional regulator with XRE-family HTH domain